MSIARLREVLRTLTPSELDGINDLKPLFLVQLEGKNLLELDAEAMCIEAQACAFGDRLTWVQLRAECELLLARLAALMEIRDRRLRAIRAALVRV